MAATTGRKTAPLSHSKPTRFWPAPVALSPLAHLAHAPQDVTLEQALRLLCMEHSQDFETWVRFMQRRVRIRTWLSLAFPSTQLNEYRECGTLDEPVVELTSTAFGLYGTLGPLPTFYTEELLEEARNDESLSRDFLDILNNRIHHCLYTATLWGRLARRTAELRNPQAVQVLHCLMGRAYPALRPEGPPQTSVLGLLLCHARSAMGLEDYCTFALGFAGSKRFVRVEQCVPRMASIPREQRCRLGQANNTLGTNTTLGEQVRDCTGKFRLHLEGLNRAEMERFLPAGKEFTAVDTHVRQYMDVPLEYDIFLHPAPETGFRQRLGERMGGYLLPAGVLPTKPVTVYHST